MNKYITETFLLQVEIKNIKHKIKQIIVCVFNE